MCHRGQGNQASSNAALPKNADTSYKCHRDSHERMTAAKCGVNKFPETGYPLIYELAVYMGNQEVTNQMRYVFLGLPVFPEPLLKSLKFVVTVYC